jgi:mono/diheme cytochrome c family protein
VPKAGDTQFDECNAGVVGVQLTRLAVPAVIVASLVAGAAAVAGCSSGATDGTRSPATSSFPAATAPPLSRRPGESQGAFVFRAQCAGCHGTRGEGNLGPSLVKIEDRMSEADELAIVRTGSGRMPAFAQGLSTSDIAAVVAYTRTHLR